jgi:hypothetical protein
VNGLTGPLQGLNGDAIRSSAAWVLIEARQPVLVQALLVEVARPLGDALFAQGRSRAPGGVALPCSAAAAVRMAVDVPLWRGA